MPSLEVPGWFSAGGPAMVLLAILSILSLAVLLAKVAQYIRLRPLSTVQADQALSRLQQGRLEEARTALRQPRSPVDTVLAGALALPPRPSTAAWQEEVLRQARNQLEPLRGGLRVLEVVGTLAPLIGLLGTVFGMIGAFQALEQTGSQVDPAALSGGIWEALLTTAAGLIVAVPVLAAFHGCDRLVEQCRHRMEDRLARARVLLAELPEAMEPSKPAASHTSEGQASEEAEEPVAASPEAHAY